MTKKTIHSFPRCRAFCDAVEAARKQPEFTPDRYAVYTEAFEAIAKVFERALGNPESEPQPINGQIADELGMIAKEITLAHMLQGTALEPYFTTAHILREALFGAGGIATVSADNAKWVEAIRIALAYNERRDRLWSVSHQPQPRHITFAKAVHFFSEKKRIEVPLVGDGVLIQSTGVWRALAATVSQPLLSLGDTRAMQFMDSLLSTRFDPVIGRVQLHPVPDLMGRKLDRSLPCGYLYRVALKALGRGRTTSTPKSAFATIETAATHLGGLYDVEPFLAHETMLPPYPARILEILVHVAIYDELFAIPQCQPEVTESLLRDLFERVLDERVSEDLQWRIEDAIHLWQLLLELTSRNATSTFVKRETFKALLTRRVGSSRTCDALLRTFVRANPNSTYHLPADAHSADTRECAIVAASADRIWIAPRPFLGPAFYARVVRACTDIDETVSGAIGRAFEARMFKRMTELGIRCRRGDIVGKKGGNAGDADLILETDEVVGLFELKKKELTRRTNAGNDLQLAVDLSLGLVHGVNQLAKQEISLRRTGKLAFVDGSELILGDRNIIKGVISLSDYGGLHDGAIVRNMLRSLQGATLTPRISLTSDQQASMEKANREFKVLGERFLEFETVKGHDSSRDLFDNLVFHNIFFIEYLLATERTAEALLRALVQGSRLITGTRDPFFDFSRFTDRSSAGSAHES